LPAFRIQEKIFDRINRMYRVLRNEWMLIFFHPVNPVKKFSLNRRRKIK